MIPRLAFQILVGALVLLIVAFAVLMGGYALAQATGDATAAAVLWWVAIGCLLLTAVDLILLVGALGVAMITPPPPRPSAEHDRRRPPPPADG